MKLKIRDTQEEPYKVEESTNYLDLHEVGIELGDEDGDPLYMWVKPAPLDDAW